MCEGEGDEVEAVKKNPERHGEGGGG